MRDARVWNDRTRNSSPAERVLQSVSSPRKPALYGTHGTPELPGCLFVWSFLDIAEYNHGAMSFGQPVDLLVNDVDRVVRHVKFGPIRGQLEGPVLDFLAALLLAFRLD